MPDSSQSQPAGIPFHGAATPPGRRPRTLLLWLIAALLAFAFLAAVLAWQRRGPRRAPSFLTGDPAYGSWLFETKGCLHCHAINGFGGHSAPDLGTGRGAEANLNELVTTMWNHAPAMWKRMQQEHIDVPVLTEGDVTNLFAFLYVARYLDEPGDPANGQRLLAAKGCLECHSVRGEGGTRGPDLAKIPGVDTPIEWAYTLWNHAPAMEADIHQVGVAWPRFEHAEMNDLLAYIRQISSAPRMENKLLPADPKRGWEMFNTKGCVNCHAIEGQGGHVGPDLGGSRGTPLTMVQFAGAMWNHSPQMYREMRARGISRPTFTSQDMADLMAFFSSLRYFEPSGSVQAGRGLFTSRGCARCHGTDGEGTGAGPALRGKNKRFTSVAMATALWRHGPEMYRRTQNLGLPWPKLGEYELGDLFAFMNSAPAERH
jgi:cytochrome c2